MKYFPAVKTGKVMLQNSTNTFFFDLIFDDNASIRNFCNKLVSSNLEIETVRLSPTVYVANCEYNRNDIATIAKELSKIPAIAFTKSGFAIFCSTNSLAEKIAYAFSLGMFNIHYEKEINLLTLIVKV